jgi:hypothetical protein
MPLARRPNIQMKTVLSIPDDLVTEIARVVKKSIRLGVGCPEGLCCSLGIYISDKVDERLKIVTMPGASETIGEIVRIYVNVDDRVPGVFTTPLRNLVEPYLIGIRQASLEDTPDGLVVIRGDTRQSDLSHLATQAVS